MAPCAWRKPPSKAWPGAWSCRSATAVCCYRPASPRRLPRFSLKEDFLRIYISLLALFSLWGCETLSYYAQAVGGHLGLMARAQPVASVIADPATPGTLRERLELARSIRDYASRELGLPENGSYRSYADLGRPYVVWNGVAEPAFSLVPVESFLPVAGWRPLPRVFARPDALT